jgi:hypothetical protein
MGSRYGAMAVDTPTWTEVSRGSPCPLCEATTGCSILENREFVRCLNLVSQWPVLAGGWLHPLPAPAVDDALLAGPGLAVTA